MKFGLMGTSSSGKTTLAKQLSEYFKFDIVKEIARKYPRELLGFESIQYDIFFDQMRSEMFSGKNVITDRTCIDNYIYINYHFKPRKYLLNLIRAWVQTYDLIFLCKKLDFIEDGFRSRNNIENDLINFFKNNLIEYEILEGNKEERFEKAKNIINRKLNK